MNRRDFIQKLAMLTGGGMFVLRYGYTGLGKENELLEYYETEWRTPVNHAAEIKHLVTKKEYLLDGRKKQCYSTIAITDLEKAQYNEQQLHQIYIERKAEALEALKNLVKNG